MKAVRFIMPGDIDLFGAHIRYVHVPGVGQGFQIGDGWTYVYGRHPGFERYGDRSPEARRERRARHSR